ncbi:MAG TPA: hypothetical protein VH969_34115 [Actinophytocola sp.]|uniref:SDH family Clp fold serine proteinase n=1 Tax=Actinophytocola sp. TaxID=1872138 RepID=UPI002F94C10D
MITPAERREVRRLGREFAQQAGGTWLMINGRFTSGVEWSTDGIVKDRLWRAFGYPDERDRTLNILLNSPGGSLDSAYATALYLAAYTKELHVYVPSRAKSASTLLAIAADKVHLSAFGELGPLDTQIPDPRNPANKVSALDCYQSVDYVRDFGFKTITKALPQLVEATERRIPVADLLATASTFAIGAIQPVLSTITALDFGGWGRNLRIGERYASKLLRAKAKDGDFARADHIAYQLVYGYTHHPFPIDLHEAEQIGLAVEPMDSKTYENAAKVLNACRHKTFIGFISEDEASRAEDQQGSMVEAPVPHDTVEDHPMADTGRPRTFSPDMGRPK